MIIFDTIKLVYITTIVIIMLLSNCTLLINTQLNSISDRSNRSKTDKNIPGLCIPDEPERTVLVEGIIGNVVINDDITLVAGPLNLCESQNGGFIGEGGGVSTVYWSQASISGEYIEDAVGKKRIKINVNIFRTDIIPEDINKQYLLLVSELPKTIVDDNSKITISLIKKRKLK